MAVYGLAVCKKAKSAIYHSSFDWTVRKLHIARKYMFYLLYYTEYMD